MFGNPETTTGGRALKFYASVRLDVRRDRDSEAERRDGWQSHQDQGGEEQGCTAV